MDGLEQGGGCIQQAFFASLFDTHITKWEEHNGTVREHLRSLTKPQYENSKRTLLKMYKKAIKKGTSLLDVYDHPRELLPLLRLPQDFMEKCSKSVVSELSYNYSSSRIGAVSVEFLLEKIKGEDYGRWVSFLAPLLRGGGSIELERRHGSNSRNSPGGLTGLVQIVRNGRMV